MSDIPHYPILDAPSKIKNHITDPADSSTAARQYLIEQIQEHGASVLGNPDVIAEAGNRKLQEMLAKGRNKK